MNWATLRLYFVIAALFILSSCESFGLCHKARHTKKARVRFLANGLCIHGTWGQNRDTYLAEMILKKNDTPQLVRIMNEYSPWGPSISHVVLTSNQGATLYVERDEQCDLSYGQMHLRSAPGDPIAALPGVMTYHLQLAKEPTSETILPCYRVSQ